jgi:tyrosinase
MSFGGHAGGQMDCQGQFGRGFGALEQPAHNTMHDGFVRGTMANPGRAAEDPMFFSFHCYIDLLWAQWQKNFETNTGLDSRLCGLFKDRKHLEENRFRVRDTRDTERQLGYIYEYTPGEVAPEQREARAPTPFRTHPALDVVASARNRPALVRTIEFSVQPGSEHALLRLTDVSVTTPFSYSADIYLTPAGEKLRTEDRAFRERHLADVLYFWQSQHSHGENTHDITVDLGSALKSLARSHAGEQWVV